MPAVSLKLTADQVLGFDWIAGSLIVKINNPGAPHLRLAKSMLVL